MWKNLFRALLGMALMVTALVVVVPSSASAGNWQATVTEYNADGRAEKFWVGSDGAVWHAWASTPGGPINSGNWSLGGHVTTGIGVTHNQDGRLEIFGRADGGDLNHMWQLSRNGVDGWSGWASLGGQLQPYTGVYADYFGSSSSGQIRVKVTGVDGLIHYLWQLGSNCCWSNTWT